MRCLLLIFFVTAVPTCVFADSLSFGSGENEFHIEFARIGNVGNAADNTDIWTDDTVIHLGKVDYVYSIGKFEVSRAIIGKANAQAGLGIGLASMERVGGPLPDMPSTGITWPEAAKFTNLLNQAHGYPDAYNFDSRRFGFPTLGPWEADDPGFDPNNPYRNSLAKFVLPSADEWHKAAYYDPQKDDGAGGYWDYPTGSDEKPLPVAGGTQEGTAVYAMERTVPPAAVDAAGGLSPYGIMGMGGNVWEYEEIDPKDDSPAPDRGLRGGSWASPASDFTDPFHPGPSPLLSSFRVVIPPTGRDDEVGFRVAMLPDAEPGDFNRDASISATDIDLLSERVRSSTIEAIFDLNGDLVLDRQDRAIWVTDIADTHFGDADLNGIVDFDDFAFVSASFNQQSGWAEGDFDGSGKTDFDDFVILANNFGRGQARVSSVPEPHSYHQLILAFMTMVILRKRSSSSVPQME